MKDRKYKKQRETAVIRIGNILLTVTGDEYAEHYADIERRKYVKGNEKGRKLSFERAICDGLPMGFLSAYDSQSVEDVVEQKIIIDLILKALAEMIPQERTIIELTYFEDKSSREIASILGISQTTVIRKKRKILMDIKNILEF